MLLEKDVLKFQESMSELDLFASMWGKKTKNSFRFKQPPSYRKKKKGSMWGKARTWGQKNKNVKRYQCPHCSAMIDLCTVSYFVS